MMPWWTKAAVLYVDMERGLHDFGTKNPPKDGEGNPRVVKKQILIECGKDPNQKDANRRIWTHPDFLELLEKERRRRDIAIVDVVHEIEAVSGPLVNLRSKMQENIQTIFERGPDAEDPEALSPKDYVSQGLQWCRYIDELTGRTKSQEEQAIQSVVSSLVQHQQITNNMVGDALKLVDKYREQQDRQMEHAGLK